MIVTISSTSEVPLYLQIVEQIRQQILAGELGAGFPMPSLRVLATELRVSLITTTRAYNDLAAEGLIVNVPGRGSFVAELDREDMRTAALSRARDDLKRLVKQTRDTGLVSREQLIAVLKEEWEKTE